MGLLGPSLKIPNLKDVLISRMQDIPIIIPAVSQKWFESADCDTFSHIYLSLKSFFVLLEIVELGKYALEVY